MLLLIGASRSSLEKNVSPSVKPSSPVEEILPPGIVIQ